MSIDPTTVSTDELRGWLTAGSQLGDDRFHGTDHRIAWVNWRDLGADTDLGPLGGAQDRLLRLAVSIAVGAPVQLRDALQELGDQHARGAGRRRPRARHRRRHRHHRHPGLPGPQTRPRRHARHHSRRPGDLVNPGDRLLAPPAEHRERK